MVSPKEMELLARRLNQAHRTAVQAELDAAGLREVGHPMLLTILQSSRGAAGEEGVQRVQVRREAHGEAVHAYADGGGVGLPEDLNF